MFNSSIVFIGLNTHKEFVDTAYIADNQDAKMNHLERISCTKLSFKN